MESPLLSAHKTTDKTAELCWGQRYIWLRHQQLPAPARNDAHIVCRFELPANASLVRVRSVLNYLIRRHEALRTTYHLDTDAGPQQRVHPPAAVPLLAVTAERDGTASPSEVIERLSAREFDLAAEWPIRACVITTAGVPCQLVMVLNHMAFDAWTMDRFEHELQVLGAGIGSGRPATLEPIRYQPIDLARYEASPQALAAKDRAMAYWRDEIAELPADTFGSRRGAKTGTGPEPHSASLTSPALLHASRRIGQRNHVWPSVVHLAAYTTVMAAYTSGEVTHLSFHGNRDSSEYTDVMTCAFSPLLVHVDCGDNPRFSEVLRRTAERFELSQINSRIPYDELLELISAESFRRGEALRIGSEVNFLSHATARSGARRTRFTRNPAPTSWAEYGADTYLRIFELSDAVVVGLNAVSAVMDADSVERFLRAYEQLLLDYDESATDLRIDEVTAMAGFLAPTGADGVRTATVDLAAVEAVLLRHPAVRAVRLSTDARGLGADVGAVGAISPAELRTHFLGCLYDHPAVRCPDWFRVRDLTGADREGAASLSAAMPVIEQGDGLADDPVPVNCPVERLLADVVAQVNGLGLVNLADSYTVAGGRVLRIPRVLAALREHGWEGVTFQQLAGGRPLRALAPRLHRGV